MSGEGFHAELCALTARYIGRGVSAAATGEVLRGMMLAHPEPARDERWHARHASIPDLVASAAQKYADEKAPHRRALAALAGRMIRERRRAAEVRDAIAAEAAALGIDAADAAAIARWVAERELAQREGCHG